MGKKENKIYTVYEHVFPNNKRYIGITKNDVNMRWEKGRGYKSQILVYRAIQLYGWENIQHNILFQNLSKQEAKAKEQELISLYHTTDAEFGYNLTIGGEGGSKYLSAEEAREARHRSSKKYYDSHRDSYQEYRIKNREDILKKKREHYYKNREKILSQQRQKRLENLEESRAKRRERYWANREQILQKRRGDPKHKEYMKKYHELHGYGPSSGKRRKKK